MTIPIETLEIKKIVVGEIQNIPFADIIDLSMNMPIFWQDGYLFLTAPVEKILFYKKMFSEGLILFEYFYHTKFGKFTHEIKNRSNQPIQIIKSHSIISKSIIEHINKAS